MNINISKDKGIKTVVIKIIKALKVFLLLSKKKIESKTVFDCVLKIVIFKIGTLIAAKNKIKVEKTNTKTVFKFAPLVYTTLLHLGHKYSNPGVNLLILIEVLQYWQNVLLAVNKTFFFSILNPIIYF
jgi:hypothetical protein